MGTHDEQVGSNRLDGSQDLAGDQSLFDHSRDRKAATFLLNELLELAPQPLQVFLRTSEAERVNA